MTQMIAFYEKEPVRQTELAIRQLPLDESGAYDFGNEPVLTRVVYVTYPRSKSRLVPFGTYEDLLMMDKFNEALRIVQMLGACEVQTQTYRGDLSKIKGEGGIGLSKAGVEFSRHGSREVSFQQLGSGGPPQDPAPLLWPDEPGFEAARRAVLLNGSHKVSITIESRSAFRLDSDIAAGLRKAGFRLAASSEKSQLQLLRLIARFPTADGRIVKPDLEADEVTEPETRQRLWRSRR